MSFALTTDQVRQRTKTVTRRLNWKTLKPGTLLQPVVKGMGLKKGERVEKIGGPIRVVRVLREPLNALLNDRLYAHDDLLREGFGAGTDLPDAHAFIAFFAKANKCRTDRCVNRIEFEYLEVPRG